MSSDKRPLQRGQFIESDEAIRMSDDADMLALKSGSLDMVKRDFRSGDLSGMDLPGRDFSESHLEKANFSRSNLEGCNFHQSHTSGLILEFASLKDAKMQQTSVFAVKFRGADLRGGSFIQSHFSRSDLTDADLRGADFRWAVFNEGTTFEGCIVDETTLFDGASIFRPLARQNAFRFYDVDRGKLIRRPPQNEMEKSISTSQSVSQDAELDAVRTEAVARIDTALRA